MGIAIPQVITEDIASGAQVIDGSLRFDKSKPHRLDFTNSGSSTTFTASMWVKRHSLGGYQHFFFSSDTSNGCGIGFDSNNKITLHSNSAHNITDRVFRDTSSWYHLVLKVTSGTADLYVNNELAKSGVSGFELSSNARIGDYTGGAYPADISMSQVYVIDGQALGPEEFGFTDPLTNTWRPKKYTGNFNNLPDIGLDGISTNPNSIDVVINRQVNKAWIKNTGGTGNYAFWKGGGDPSDPSSEPSFYLPSGGNLYWFTTAYDSAHTMVIGSLSSETGTQPEWDSSGTTGSLTRDSATQVSGTPSSSYASARTEALADNTVYAFTFSINTGALGNHTGWFLSTSSSYSTGVPDEQTSGNTVGARYDGSGSAYYNYVAVYGTFATINPNTMHNSIPKLSFRGVNSFYLPFDGNSPIGEDKSGRGNNWTPVNFGGSNTIEKATGALPILNTVSGGNAATVGVRTDAFASNLVLALPLVDTITDASGDINSAVTSKTIAAYQNAAPANDGQGMFYGVSVYLDGADDYIETSNSSDFVVGTGDFTIEAWYNVAASQGENPRLFAQNVNDNINWDCYIHGNPATGTNAIKMHGGSVDLGMSFPSANAWHHFCIARKNGTLYSFMNGVLRHTQTYTNFVGANNHGFRVGVIGGSGGSTGYGLSGYVQDFRFYKGVAKYTSDFIPASTKPDILPDTPSGVSGSSKLTKITNGSVSFDGTNDYLSIPWSSDFELGTSEFTIEFFVNFQDNATQSTLLSWGADIDNRFDIGCQSTNQLRVFANSGGNALINGFTKIGPKKWYHVAVVGYSDIGGGSTAIAVYVDGERRFIATGALDTYAMPTDTSNGIDIGRRRYDTSVTDYFGGFISNLRIVKGSAIYPYQLNITVPTEPLTNVTNTTLLCCQDNTSTDNTWNTRMFIADSAYTDKLSVLGYGTEVFGGESISGKYIFIVPNSNDPSSSSDFIWSGNGALTHPYGSGNVFHVSKRVSGSWVHTYGSYGPDDYSSFYYGNDTGSFQLDKTHDFYGLSRNGDGDAGPGEFTGTLPYLSRYLSTAVSPSSVRTHGGVSLSNFNPFYTDINTVRGQETGYCTWNPLGSTTYTLTNGNLDASFASGSNNVLFGTIGVTSSKWYWEVTPTSGVAAMIGIVDLDVAESLMNYGQAGGLYMFQGTGGLYGQMGGSFSDTDYGTATSIGDVIGVALDMDNGNVTFYKNGVSFGVANTSTLVGKTIAPGYGNGGGATTTSTNFGQKPFKFPPPNGYQPLNAANAKPETVIARPDQYVGVTTYSGNVSTGTGTQQIKLGMQPDLVWIKKRFSTNAQHRLVDSVRGPNQELYSDTDQDSGSNNGLNSFDPDGFTVWTSNAGYNELGQDYVAWTWKAGGDKNTFNVDGVGYANASDVNMNAGGLNDTLYDQSQRWRNYLTSSNGYSTNYGPEKAFNGVFDSNGGAAADVGNTTFTFTPPAMTVTSLEVNCYSPTTITLPDGTTQFVQGSFGINNNRTVNIGSGFSFTGSNSITFTVASGDLIYLERIKINGKELVDDDVTVTNVPSISATGCSIGTKHGFSIVKYTGSGTDNDTVPHGLLQKPDLVIVKNIDRSSTEWRVWHSGFGDNRNLKLGSDGAQDKNYWADGNVYGYTSSDISIILSGPPSTTTAEDVNLSGDNYIMYSWHDVPGLQKFGSFTGVNDPDGPFIELGFRPAIIWVKRISGSGNNWVVKDSETEKQNPVSDYLLLNSSGNTASGLDTDFLSNGFKIRNTNGNMNASSTYIYCAWAESPSFNLYGAVSNAR